MAYDNTLERDIRIEIQSKLELEIPIDDLAIMMFVVRLDKDQIDTLIERRSSGHVEQFTFTNLGLKSGIHRTRLCEMAGEICHAFGVETRPQQIKRTIENRMLALTTIQIRVDNVRLERRGTTTIVNVIVCLYGDDFNFRIDIQDQDSHYFHYRILDIAENIARNIRYIKLEGPGRPVLPGKNFDVVRNKLSKNLRCTVQDALKFLGGFGHAMSLAHMKLIETMQAIYVEGRKEWIPMIDVDPQVFLNKEHGSAFYDLMCEHRRLMIREKLKARPAPGPRVYVQIEEE